MNEQNRHRFAEFLFTEERLASLVWLGDQLPGGFFLYKEDERQELLHANRATLNIFGCESMEEFRALTGFTFRGMVHPEDYERVQSSICKQIADDSNQNMDYVEYRILRRDGEVRWVEDYGHFTELLNFGGVYYVFLSDVTEKRRSQEERRRMELALLEERHANEIKSNFLFNLSHDIRTPMNAILGFSELARRHIHEPALVAEYLDKTVTSSRQMLSLIDDMLEMNRLGTGHAELKAEPVELRGQIEQVLEQYRKEARERQLSLREELALDGQRVLVDPQSFRRLLGNLLSNAVKFTPPRGSVTLSARQSAGPEGMVYTITVADTGIGMTHDFMERMYEPFEREMTSTQSGTFGTGLGLPIVKNLVERMGGTLSAESEKGRGTTFTLTLPLPLAPGETSDAPVSEHAQAETAPAEPLRVLIVEDVEFNRMLAETLLEEEGFLTECAVNGQEAVEAVAQHSAGYYDLILMDIQMPVMNGYDATRAIRRLEEKGTVPIVALSANAREEDRRMSRESGMDAHMAKPFDIEELAALIRNMAAGR